MKKLSLKNLKLGANEMLQRSQLKSVFGGYSGAKGDCSVTCNSGVTIPRAPNCADSTINWACINQGGPKICVCLVHP